MSRSDSITRDTLRTVDERLEMIEDALDAEAYSAAAEFATEVADLLGALNARLVQERIDAGSREERSR